MKASEKDIALFDRYMKGLLSVAEQQHLEGQLRQDKNLSEAFQEYVDMVRSLNLTGEVWLKTEFDRIEEETTAEEMDKYNPNIYAANSAKKAKRWTIMSWVMIVGSVLLLVAFLIAIMSLPDLEKKFQSKKPIVTEELDVTDKIETTCIIINAEPFIMLQEDFPSVVSEIIDTIRLQNDFVNYQLCVKQDSGKMHAILVPGPSMDTVKLDNFNCDEVKIYLHPTEKHTVYLRCKYDLYTVNVDGFGYHIVPDSFYIDEAETGNLNYNLDEPKIIKNESIQTKSQGIGANDISTGLKVEDVDESAHDR